jgi:E3 ubiquitin-protein ligase RNF14
VREGDCSQVRCPDEKCIAKKPSLGQNGDPKTEDKEAREEDIRRVLSEDEVKRWKWLRAKRDIDRGT